MVSHYRYSWQSKFLPNFDANTILGKDNVFRLNLDDLRANTQYAYYVKTQVSLKTEDKVLNITQGQSGIKYFHTFPHRPIAPFVTTLTKSNDSITLTWHQPSWDDRPYIEHYTVNVYVLIDRPELLDRRDYCKDPKEPESLPIEQFHVEDRECCQRKVDNEPQREAFIGLNGANETCGENDPECTLRYGYSLEFNQYRRAFGHWLSGLHAAPSIREIDYIDFPLPRYLNYEGKTETSSIKPIQSQYQQYLVQRNISNMTSHYRIDNLQPYTLYVVHFFACNPICSPYFMHMDRTNPNEDGDNVDLTVIQDAVQYNTIHVKVPSPLLPNGITLTYEIERRLPNGDRVVDCITRKRHEMKSNGYIVYF